jgi:hypothetical protein
LTNVEEQAFMFCDITPASDLPTARLPLNICLVLDQHFMQGCAKEVEGTRQL